MKYDIIFISESNFQDKIVEHLIFSKFQQKKILWIRKKDNQFVTNDKVKFELDLNSFKSITRSLSYFYKDVNLSCEKLISPQITGVHARFLSMKINYSSLEMYDDGIGTLVIVENQNYFKDYYKQILKLTLIRTLFFIFNLKLIPNTSKIISNIKVYYSVYPMFNTGLNTIPIDLLKLNYTIINNAAFIGMPLVEYTMISDIDYIRVIKQLIEKHGFINYYPDPSETLIYSYEIEGLKIIQKDMGIEHYFSKHGLPKNIYSFTSSALLNIKMGSKTANLHYIKIPKSDKLREIYYRIFEKCGIKEYHV